MHSMICAVGLRVTKPGRQKSAWPISKSSPASAASTPSLCLSTWTASGSRAAWATTGSSCNSTLGLVCFCRSICCRGGGNLLLGKFQFQSERCRKSICQIDEAHQQVQFDNLRVGKVLFQRRDVAIVYVPWCARQFFSKCERGFVLVAEIRAGRTAQCIPILSSQAGFL